jgi:hypothetical protein
MTPKVLNARIAGIRREESIALSCQNLDSARKAVDGIVDGRGSRKNSLLVSALP